MKPHVSLIEPMVPETDAAYCVHRLFAAHDRAALIAAIGSSVRAIVTAFVSWTAAGSRWTTRRGGPSSRLGVIQG